MVGDGGISVEPAVGDALLGFGSGECFWWELGVASWGE